MTVRVTAPAKVNLCLGVGPVRADGYHPLATVYTALELHDVLDLTLPAPDEPPGSEAPVVTVGGRVDTSGVPTGGDNLAVRAVSLLAAHHGRALPAGLRLHLDKGIPVAGGLAGGSADAAAALVACLLYTSDAADE